MPIYIKNQEVWKRIKTTEKPVNPSRWQLWGWGANGIGQLSLNDTINRSVPVQVSAHSQNPESWRNLIGGNHTVALKSDGTIWGWGWNNCGQIGDNTIENRSEPVRIGSVSDWEQIAGNANTSYGIRSDGTLWGWGTNDYGQLGLGLTTTPHKSTPIRMGSSSNWELIGGGYYHFFAKNSTNQLYACGRNNYGQLGLGYDWDRYILTYQGTTTAVEISGGAAHTMILASNGTLWATGMDFNGQLGVNTWNINRSNFVQVGTASDWKKICCGGHHNLALKDNGTLWSWGDAGYGQLGHNNIIFRSTPVQIGSLSDWTHIHCGTHSSFALRSNGWLYSWGMNNNGELGIGNIIFRSAPIRIGTGSNWRNIFGSAYAALGLRYE
jgi:alpha-tubulin suppressor-like RCC1 family protein